ncbi:MAG: NAD(P)H-quinone oxidoreductase [Thermoanaerobaculales bacterium]|nr:NAD(P)H-quinone oxidoreductase [Thermoanaerobaculales bacterium]
MKSVVCEGHGEADVLRVVETAAPVVSGRFVRVAVRAAGLNRADLLQRRGLYPPPPGAPAGLGLECAGLVDEIGEGVRAVRPGDRVMGLVAGGGQSELVAVHEGSLLAAPEHLGDAEAGAFPEVFLTAYLNLFLLGGLEPDATALVHGGSGGVGTAAIALATEAGARVLVTAGSDERCRRCRELGAALAVNYRDGDFVPAVLEATEGRGVEVVLDCVGGAYLEPNLRVLAPDGALVVIGLGGGRTGELDLARMLTRRLRVIGSTLRALSDERKETIVASFRGRFGAALAAGRLRPVIDRVYPMDRVAEAHRRLASGEAFGKVVLSVP